MPEMVVMMARRKFEQTVVGSDMRVWVADNNVGIPDVRRLHRKADDRPYSWCNAAFHHAAGCGVKLFVAHYPLISQKLAVDHQIRQTCCIRLAVGTLKLRVQRKRQTQKQTKEKSLFRFH